MPGTTRQVTTQQPSEFHEKPGNAGGIKYGTENDQQKQHADRHLQQHPENPNKYHADSRNLDNLVKLKQTYPELLVRVRTPVIPGFNDSFEAIGDIVDVIRDMPNINYELLAYHRMGSPKYAYLGRDYPLEGTDNLPEKKLDELRRFAASRVAQTDEAQKSRAMGK